MGQTSNHFILILCGGSGPRLWPLSHASKPKQFLNIVGKSTLLEETVDRFAKTVPRENIYLVSGQKYLSQIKKLLGSLILTSNLIVEPEKKNTAMAILFAAATIAKTHPDAVITAVPSDHFVADIRQFKEDVKLASSVASRYQKIVAIGIRPTFANPGFGYILTAAKTNGFYPAVKFVEKPSVPEAQVLIAKDALWNSGIYTFTAAVLTNEFKLHCPEYYVLYQRLLKNLDKPRVVARIYRDSLSLSIDKAISEKSKNLVLVRAHFVWSDVGEWQSIWRQLTKNDDGIAKMGDNTRLVSHHSKNCLVHGLNKKLVGLVGLNNLAVIDTPDALLVCDLNDSFSVRDLVAKIVADPKLKSYFLTNHDQ